HKLSIVGQLGPQRLDGDLPPEHGISGGIDLSDAAFAEQPFQFVGAYTARVQPDLHRSRRCLARLRTARRGTRCRGATALAAALSTDSRYPNRPSPACRARLGTPSEETSGTPSFQASIGNIGTLNDGIQ